MNAALVVHTGWTGVNDVLSGPNNFVESYNPKADPAGMVDQLGELYGVMVTTLKKWTTGGPIQAPLDALEFFVYGRTFAGPWEFVAFAKTEYPELDLLTPPKRSQK